jgi:glutathione S-transferase
LVTLQLFGHPFSSYTWKVLIALWADETPFEFRMLGPDHPENGDELRRRWPFGQFPLLVDGDRSVAEATCIIEHLQAHHPGPNRWIPDGEQGRRVRFLDRVFDLRVMANMQAVVFDALRPAEHRNPADRSIARERLRTAYGWLEANLDRSPWAIGEQFTLADCAAAPSLFYADWVEEIDGYPQLKAYRARLLAHPVVARAVDEARPYRPFFPLGAPDRD